MKSHLAVEGALSAPSTPNTTSSGTSAQLLKSLGFDKHVAALFILDTAFIVTS
jgi:hypothetical protein